MKDNNLARVGGILSILLGVAYIALGALYLLVPLRPGILYTGEYLETLAANLTIYRMYWWAFALTGVLGVGVVPAISGIVKAGHEGWVRWTGNLALLGFAALAVSFFRVMAVGPGLAQAYVAAEGDASARAAMLATGTPTLDPYNILTFAGVGAWIFVVNLFALRGSATPKPLVYIGMAVAILYLFVTVGFVLDINLLTRIAAGLGGIVGAPIWYIWMGLQLRKPTA